MRHLADELLVLYGQNIDLAPAGDAAHLAECRQCADVVAEHQAFEAMLRDPKVWTPEFAAVADDPTLKFHELIAEEDLAAAELLAPYEEMVPARFAWLDLASDARFQNGGVVRRLCRRANAMCERNPLYALAIADAAVSISAALVDDIYPRHAVHEIRGESWKERANALDALGRYPEAFEALCAAEAEYQCLPHPGAGMVSVSYIRSSLLYEQEQFAEAEKFAIESARAALHLAMTDRYMRARHLLALIRSDQHQYAAALEIARDLLQRGETSGDELWIARESLVVGGCELELGNVKEAARHLTRARTLHAKLGSVSEVIRTDWCIARLKAREGETKEAIRRLRTCIAEFSRIEMLTDAALVAVDVSEMLLGIDRAREVPAVLAGVAKRFTEAGKLTSALTALAYLSDAAVSAAAPIPPQVIGYVRRFILRADRDRELMFAPPPEL